jgi:hypothetical protein
VLKSQAETVEQVKIEKESIPTIPAEPEPIKSEAMMTELIPTTAPSDTVAAPTTIEMPADQSQETVRDAPSENVPTKIPRAAPVKPSLYDTIRKKASGNITLTNLSTLDESAVQALEGTLCIERQS